MLFRSLKKEIQHRSSFQLSRALRYSDLNKLADKKLSAHHFTYCHNSKQYIKLELWAALAPLEKMFYVAISKCLNYMTFLVKDRQKAKVTDRNLVPWVTDGNLVH